MNSSGQQLAAEASRDNQPVAAAASSASESQPASPTSSSSDSQAVPSAPGAAPPAATASAAGGTLLNHRPPRRKLAEAKQAGPPRAVDTETATAAPASAAEPSASPGSRGGGEAGGSEEGEVEGREGSGEKGMGKEENEEAERVLAAAQDRVETAILGRAEVGDRRAAEAEEAGLAATDEALQSLSPALEAVAAGPWLPAEDDRQRIRTQLLQVLEDDGWRVTQPVLRIWQGERDALALTRGLDVGSAQAVLLVLFRVKVFEKEHGPPPRWNPPAQ